MFEHDEHHHHAGDGPVVLDIGGSIGAVVLTAPSRLVGREVEALPQPSRDGDGPPVHVGVVARPLPGTAELLPTAVFGALQEGTYELVLRDEPDAARLVVHVTGGSVTSADWPASGPVAAGR
jgi:hypothetical protein